MKKRSFGPEPSYPYVDNYVRPTEHHGLISIAGPCSIESESQILEVLNAFENLPFRPTYVRGGPWTYGTYPPKEPGLRREHLKLFTGLVREAGHLSIVECLDIRELDKIAEHSDAIQIGARQMQNYPLLIEAGKLGKTITLKRHVGATLDEFLGAAEYILKSGMSKLILIERGSATYHNHVRWGVDISVIAHVAKHTRVPILVDASHGTGRRDLVEPVLKAGLAGGAAGFLVETHPNPSLSVSDAEQAYPLAGIKELFHNAAGIRSLVDFQRRSK